MGQRKRRNSGRAVLRGAAKKDEAQYVGYIHSADAALVVFGGTPYAQSTA